MVTIREATGGSDIVALQALFEEYAASLGVDLEFQGFAQELATLPGAYSRPGGVLLLASVGERFVGCVGVRNLGSEICEMKRLYVRAKVRDHGVGRALALAAIDFAREAGYRAMRLDTLPSMVVAQQLYRSLGFRDVPPYRHNPMPGASFMELILGSGSAT